VTAVRADGGVETILSRRLRDLEARIAGSESTGIQARWEFGRALLARRVGKQLPAGLLAQVCADVGVSRSELAKRMRFAERYPTEEQVRNAVAQFGSWHRIVAEALPEPSVPAPGVSPALMSVLNRVAVGAYTASSRRVPVWERSHNGFAQLHRARLYLREALSWLRDADTLSIDELDKLGEEVEHTAALVEELRQAHGKRCDTYPRRTNGDAS
jgi:hypothetical protein